MKTPELDHVCVFCGANVGNRPAYVEAARALGRAFAENGVTMIYGGGGIGLMMETAQAAMRAGGTVVGIITEALMAREAGNRDISELHVVQTMHERKAMMAEKADAFVVLPGGYGTLDETCEMLTWNQLAILATPVILVDVEGFFAGFLMQLDRAVADGVLKPQHRAMLTVVSSAADVLPAIRAWRPVAVPAAIAAADVKP
jgi:uncharacterized protein (TIGR00730 family)